MEKTLTIRQAHFNICLWKKRNEKEGKKNTKIFEKNKKTHPITKDKVRSLILSGYTGFYVLQRYWRVPNLILARYVLVPLVLIHVRLPL
jgi:hypothetical protein